MYSTYREFRRARARETADARSAHHSGASGVTLEAVFAAYLELGTEFISVLLEPNIRANGGIYSWKYLQFGLFFAVRGLALVVTARAVVGQCRSAHGAHGANRAYAANGAYGAYGAYGADGAYERWLLSIADGCPKHAVCFSSVVVSLSHMIAILCMLFMSNTSSVPACVVLEIPPCAALWLSWRHLQW